LVQEGWLHSVAGTGTFVSEDISQKEEQLKRKSKNIALVFRLPLSPLDSPYYSKIFMSIQQEVSRRGYYFSFYSFFEESGVNMVKIARERNHSGFIFVGEIKDKIILEAHRAGIPLVLLDNYMSNKDITSVVPDNRGGAFEATSYLAKLGHRSIYFFGRKPDDAVATERFNGYREALAAAGIPYKEEFLLTEHNSFADGYRSMDNVLKSKKIPTAIFAFNDETAIGAMKAIREKSDLQIPKDISIIGFDDIDWAAHSTPPLTTIGVRKEEMGVLVVKYLVEHIEGNNVINAKIVSPVDLVIRSSCAKPYR